MQKFSLRFYPGLSQLFDVPMVPIRVEWPAEQVANHPTQAIWNLLPYQHCIFLELRQTAVDSGRNDPHNAGNSMTDN